MSNLCKSVLALWVIGMALAVSAPALAATNAAGPYYATPSWDQKLECTLASCPRFIVLTNWSSEAVLDRETGLVWERSPITQPFDWLTASFQCIRLNKGGRRGWRLPTIQDLSSLIDPTASNPALPSGNPFTVQSSVYWSATADASRSANVWGVSFSSGSVVTIPKSSAFFVWCVRGGPGVDPQ